MVVDHSVTAVVFGAGEFFQDTRRFKIWYPHHFFFSFPTGFFSGGAAFNLGCGLWCLQSKGTSGEVSDEGKLIEIATKFSRVG